MTKYPEIVTEYVGIERGAVQQVMYRADMGRGHAETRCRVWDLDGRPYVFASDMKKYGLNGEKGYLDEDEARIAREARNRPYQPIVSSITSA